MKHVLGSLTIAFTMAIGLMGLTSASAQDAADDPAQLDAGKILFETNCATCHGLDGTGSDTGRNLTDIAIQQPDRSVHIASVTDGKGIMPAWGGRLTPDEIDAAVAYVRLTFVSQVEPEPELAVTGTGLTATLIVGVSMLVFGALVVGRARRHNPI